MAVSISSNKSEFLRSSKSYREGVRKGFREQVFSLLKMGYERLERTEYVNSEETDITGELVRSMRHVTQDSTVPWASRFAIHDDPPVNAFGRRGKRRPRLDIQIERTCLGPHSCYSFEAKRLSAGKSGVSEYLGSGGLGAYLDGTYAREDSEAGMLGYVQSHSQEHWREKISERFLGDSAKSGVSSGGGWAEVLILPALKHCYFSKHYRVAVGKPITIYHLLLSFL